MILRTYAYVNGSSVRIWLFLNMKVPDDLDSRPNFDSTDIGYIEPGHGLKGKKQWLHSNDDLAVMYEKHAGRRSILLWAYSVSGKEKSTSQKKGTNYEEHRRSLSEVDEKYEALRKKHGTKYSPEQLRMWAQLIRLGKHESMEEPPDKPFWRGRKRRHDSDSQPASNVISPKKKISVRSEIAIGPVGQVAQTK